MAIKDLRISLLRTFLTGLSMFIGIISMITAVLVGTLGKESLLSINAQISGYSLTYSISVVESNFADANTIVEFIDKLQITNDKTVVINPIEEFKFAPMDSIYQLIDVNKLFGKLRHMETVYTSPEYNKIYNIPIFKGRWFEKNDKMLALEVVVNKEAYKVYNAKYIVASNKGTLTPNPFSVVGVINDGKKYPVIYLNIKPILFMHDNFKIDVVTVYWHNRDCLTIEQMKSHINDILYDTIGGKVDNITLYDNSEDYIEVINLLQIGLIVSSSLLLFVSILGQINIGLSSLEQRTQELLVRRALGASKSSIAMLVLSSLFILSVIVCVISVLVSVLLVNLIGVFLPNDSPVTIPPYPIVAALVAVIVSASTALLGGLIPAIKAAKLEPALALR